MEEVNFKVVQGDTFSIRLIYKNPDGTKYDLTDYTARMDIRDKPGGKILCASATEDNNGIIIDGANGTIDVEFTPAQTKKFTLPSSAYQIQIINNDNGKKTTLTKGHIQVDSAVIR